MRKIETIAPVVNGTKVVTTLMTLAGNSAALYAAPASESGSTFSESHWPMGTVALAIVMVFYTWWLQVQHRKRMEQANAELSDVVYRQGQELESLRAQLSDLVRRLEAAVETRTASSPPDEIPPHY
jgi:uncharacterized coiled-coil protein SlyX